MVGLSPSAFLSSPGTAEAKELVRRGSRRPTYKRGSGAPVPTSHLPEPLRDGERIEVGTLRDVPDKASLELWLRDRGVDTENWGQGHTKDAGHLWKEIKLDEAGLELWRKADGNLQAVRVVHVLRAKVCSPQSYLCGKFLFNTWQQFGDGRKRTRNGLLSEKLAVSEMPLQGNLHAVCCRAVGEELQFLADSAFHIPPGGSPPEYDASYVSPLQVVEEHFVEHTIELEVSKSFTGLLTMYNLYTVEVVCNGLPGVDFNSLEFKSPDEHGNRSLKYIHAWTWLEWPQIQRYLFEGSELKERKTRGSFESVGALSAWLGQFDVDLACWDTDSAKSVEQLFQEVESGEAQLEHWGRHDGAPLLMRVVHVMQLEVCSRDPWLAGQILLQTWEQKEYSKALLGNKFLSKTLRADMPLDEARFSAAARELVSEKLSCFVDPHFRLQEDVEPQFDELEVQVMRADLGEKRVSVNESNSYPGICTLYHLYEMHVECEGLPSSEFATVDYRPSVAGGTATEATPVRGAQGFTWVTWQQYAHSLRSEVMEMRVKQSRIRGICDEQQEAVEVGLVTIEGLSEVLQRLSSRTPVEDQDPDVAEAQRLLRDLETSMARVGALKQGVWQRANRSERIPPSMLSEMTQASVVPEECLSKASHALAEEARWAAEIKRLLREGAILLPDLSDLASLQSQLGMHRTASEKAGTPHSQLSVGAMSNTAGEMRRTKSLHAPTTKAQFQLQVVRCDTDEPPFGGRRGSSHKVAPAEPMGVPGQAGHVKESREQERDRMLEAFRRAFPEDGGIPLDLLARLVLKLSPGLVEGKVRNALSVLSKQAGAEEAVGCQEFVDWLYQR